MADASGASRRVSMAYILGFSNKPFKDGGPAAPPPAPRHPSAFRQMVTTPGGVIEWAASDGRRGRLTGPGMPRLTASSLAQVPEGKASSVKAADEDDGGMFGLFEDAPAAKAAFTKAADDGQPSNSDWTKEQDGKLMELKGENKPWADIATEVDKKENECKGRFKQIKPKDWKPSNVKGGGGGKQPKDKQKNKRGQKQQDGDKRDEDKKDGAADCGFDANAWPGGGDSGDNDTWGNNNNTGDGGGNVTWEANDSGGNNGTTWGGDGDWGAADNKSEKKDDANDQWGDGGWGNTDRKDGDNKADDSFNGNNNGSGGGSGDNAATGDWGNSNVTGGNTGGGDGVWNSGNDSGGWGAPANDAIKDSNSKKASSTKDSSSDKANQGSPDKAASQSGFKHRFSRSSEKASSSALKEYELRPDSTFSADDLRLIAKILQQDCWMVWNRVSWRFKDKTGRNLHPDVFEKKITGKIGDRGSERGRR